LRRSLHTWDRRRWQGLTGKLPPADPPALHEHLAATLHAIAGRPLPPEETEAVVRRLLRPAGEIERYPDVAPCLDRLRTAGVRVGIVTPLPAETARWLLHRVGIPETLLLSRDPSLPSLPDREAFREAVGRLSTSLVATAYVGDLYWSDVHAAHRAGLASYLLDRTESWPRVVTGRMRTLADLETTLQGSSAAAVPEEPGTSGGPPGPAGEPI
jgi:HAD superfamily hydrolase (TIGR01549 family)